jgi:hypothetical protein
VLATWFETGTAVCHGEEASTETTGTTKGSRLATTSAME